MLGQDHTNDQPNVNCTARSGAIIPLFAILLPVMFILVAFVINIAYIQLTETQLQVSTDAAARAAGRIFQITGDQDATLDIANQIGQENLVASDALEFQASDMEFGRSVRSSIDSRYLFTTGGSNPNAIRLSGRRDPGSISGQVDVLLPSIIGVQKFNLASVAESTQVEVDIALVFDRSGSMAYAFNEPAVFPPIPATAPSGWNFDSPVPPNSRWLDAVDATQIFLDELNSSPQEEFVSLTTYSSDSTLDATLTGNHMEILLGLDFYTQSLGGGGTNISSGLNLGADSLVNGSAREFAAKVILLLTDGKKNLGSNPVTTAEAIAEDGIMIFTVTFSDEADQSLMQSVADKGQGQHFHATTGNDLRAVFLELGRQLPTLITK